jgi:CysZ protein
MGNPIHGANYLFRGLRLLTEPELRPFIIWPLLINCLLFSIAIYLLSQFFGYWVDYSLQLLPEWLQFIDWLLWPLFALLVLVGVYFSFGTLAGFIAAPFNGLLAERVEQRQRGELLIDENWKSLLATVPRALQRETQKLAYYLPRIILVLVLLWLPLFGPLIWFLFGAWMMAIQYCDYPMDNNRIPFAQMRLLLKQRRLMALGFGSLVSLAMLIPILNLVIMPAAVIGATLMWLEEFASQSSRKQLLETG